MYNPLTTQDTNPQKPHGDNARVYSTEQAALDFLYLRGFKHVLGHTYKNGNKFAYLYPLRNANVSIKEGRVIVTDYYRTGWLVNFKTPFRPIARESQNATR